MKQGERWGLSAAEFQAAIEAAVKHAFDGREPTAAERDKYISSLHLDDLALACACAAGNERAWEHFVREFRPVLYRSADAIDPAGGAREVADSLYAELFGLRERDEARQSLFRYFHGRSSLATWLRAVLSQRYIDRLRAAKRHDALPESDAEPLAAKLVAPEKASASDPDRSRYERAMRVSLAAAIAALAPRDRLRLSCYYAQSLTLAEIGRMLREHEGTVSRHLTRTRKEIRADVEARLRKDHAMDRRAISECFRSVVDDAGGLDLAELIGKESNQDRSR
jgi:RNA polymerase sigma-70 factor (ECF subfamily)